jgi:hypothetical protein
MIFAFFSEINFSPRILKNALGIWQNGVWAPLGLPSRLGQIHTCHVRMPIAVISEIVEILMTVREFSRP